MAWPTRGSSADAASGDSGRVVNNNTREGACPKREKFRLSSSDLERTIKQNCMHDIVIKMHLVLLLRFKYVTKLNKPARMLVLLGVNRSREKHVLEKRILKIAKHRNEFEENGAKIQ